MEFQNSYAEDENQNQNQNHYEYDHSHQEADRLAAMNPSGRVDIGEQEHFEGGRLKCTGDMCVLEDNDSAPLPPTQVTHTKSDAPSGRPYLTYLLYLVLLLVIIAIGYFGYKRFICKE